MNYANREVIHSPYRSEYAGQSNEIRDPLAVAHQAVKTTRTSITRTMHARARRRYTDFARSLRVCIS
jgi:hypothetical protein